MTITPETKAELRRLHAELQSARMRMRSGAFESADKWEAAIAAVRAAMRDLDIATERTIILLLNALEAAQAERDRMRAIEKAAVALRDHIRRIAYRDAAGIRLGGDTSSFIVDLDEALGDAP